MDVRHHQDSRKFRALAGELYSADPVRHTVALTVMARSLTDDPPAGQEPPVMVTVHDGGAVVGAALRSPPWPMIVSGLPVDTMDAVVARWLQIDPELPGVNGPRGLAEAFAATWARHTGAGLRETMAGRLYRLTELSPPTVPGRMRLASDADIHLLAGWQLAFQVEAIGHERQSGDRAEHLRRLLAMGDGLALWELDGQTVSWALASKPVDGMSRVGPVYTPPEQRGRGYGSAITAAISRWARDAGADQVLLFTDLANPTSNSIYQKIGYRPVYDSTELEFTSER